MLMKKCMALVIVLALFTLCGCAGRQSNPASPEDDPAVTFTDALGRSITVAHSPKRVAALIGSFADVWLLSGGNICATVDDAWNDFGLTLPDAVNLGGAHSPGLELLLAANPDFVLASASTSSNVAMKDALESAGITVAYFDVDCFDDYLAMLAICTDITGRKDLCVQNGEKLKAQIDTIKDRCLRAELTQAQRTILLLRASSGSVKAKNSEGTVLGEMLSDLGCINIADSDKSLLETLSVESIIRQEPYRIFVVTMGDDTQKALDHLTEWMDENPAWHSLTAVKENRLHVMDRKLYNLKPNAKWAESYEKLSEILLEPCE